MKDVVQVMSWIKSHTIGLVVLAVVLKFLDITWATLLIPFQCYLQILTPCTDSFEFNKFKSAICNFLLIAAAMLLKG